MCECLRVFLYFTFLPQPVQCKSKRRTQWPIEEKIMMTKEMTLRAGGNNNWRRRRRASDGNDEALYEFCLPSIMILPSCHHNRFFQSLPSLLPVITIASSRHHHCFFPSSRLLLPVFTIASSHHHDPVFPSILSSTPIPSFPYLSPSLPFLLPSLPSSIPSTLSPPSSSLPLPPLPPLPSPSRRFYNNAKLQ